MTVAPEFLSPGTLLPRVLLQARLPGRSDQRKRPRSQAVLPCGQDARSQLAALRGDAAARRTHPAVGTVEDASDGALAETPMALTQDRVHSRRTPSITGAEHHPGRPRRRSPRGGRIGTTTPSSPAASVAGHRSRPKPTTETAWPASTRGRRAHRFCPARHRPVAPGVNAKA